MTFPLCPILVGPGQSGRSDGETDGEMGEMLWTLSAVRPIMPVTGSARRRKRLAALSAICQRSGALTVCGFSHTIIPVCRVNPSSGEGRVHSWNEHMVATAKPSVLDAALLYAENMGWRIVVLHEAMPGKRADGQADCSCGRANCTSQGKHPRLKKWGEVATSDPSVIHGLWTTYPGSNVGAALGSGSAIVSIDVDPPNGEAFLAALSNGDIPPTPELMTGKGRSLILGIPEDLEVEPKTVAYKDAAGEESVRLQSTGSQRVLPPSLHPSGRYYAWVPGKAPGEIAIAPMPGWLIVAMCTPKDPVWADPQTHGPRDCYAPGADYNRRGSWDDLLNRHGYKDAGTNGKVRYFTRPGKTGGISVTLNYFQAKDGTPALYIFSGNCPKLSAGRCYDMFGTFARLEHGEDFSNAAKALITAGYGDPKKKTTARVAGSGHFVPVAPGTPGTVQPAAETESEPVLIQMSTVKRRKVEWLWYPWLAAGEFSLLDGDPGIAKSTLTIDLIARISRGWEMPPSASREVVREPAGVVIMSAEDEPETVIRPRLDAAGADCERVWFFPKVKTGNESRLPIIPLDIELLANFLKEHQRPKLLTIDPMMAFLGNDVDAHRDNEIRASLSRAVDAIRKMGTSLLMVRHLNKMNLAPAMYRGGGSIGIIGSARVAIVVGRDPEDSQKRIMAQEKNNLAPIPPSLVYHLESDPVQECGKIAWDGQSDLIPDEILGHAPGAKRGRPADRLEAAKAFLKDALKDGPLPSATLTERAKEAGITFRTLRVARDNLEVVASKIGDEWWCELPPKPTFGTPIPD